MTLYVNSIDILGVSAPGLFSARFRTVPNIIRGNLADLFAVQNFKYCEGF